ncbi:MAG: 50S ribosomal protein L4 [Spirochaetes bacterium GWF1_51_8]|nr:MAG: 50S ribosomal protein L4 [Spirochaetes bacterium GWF1_51_8]
MKIEVYEGKTKTNEMKLSKLWDDVSEKVLHQVVVARLANDRQGNASTKTKSEVRGGGRKPWKQKGLGRARAGSTRSPLWRGGGVMFGPKPRDFSQNVNKKQKAKAYLYVFNKLNQAGNLTIIGSFKVESHKTKAFMKSLSALVENLEQRIVVVVPEYDKNMVLGCQNLPKIKVMSVDNLDILPLVYAAKVFVVEEAMKKLDEKFSNILNVEK